MTTDKELFERANPVSTLSGRVDSLTAPAFLKAWEEESGANKVLIAS